MRSNCDFIPFRGMTDNERVPATPVTLAASDGVRIAAWHHAAAPGADPDLCLVMGHGFTCHQGMRELQAIAGTLNRTAAVCALDYRGHGRSGGLSTVGDREVHDLEAALRYAAERHAKVVTVGFSMGASIALRHAALMGGVDAVVSVSSPARWYYRDTVPMRRVHWAVERRLGRAAVRLAKRTRIAPKGWDPIPEAPFEVVGGIACPLLIVHGGRDAFFPPDHGELLYERASDPRELWLEPEMGHAEIATTEALSLRIAQWAARAAAGPLAPKAPQAG